jgi:nucleolar protein 4
VTLKKRLDNLSKPPNAFEKGGKSSKAPAPNHASRLIVRNIPFNVTEQDLRAIFLPYGPIHSIHIPTDEKHNAASKEEDQGFNDGASTTRKPRMKGFGFVWMLSKKDAEKAIQGCNGTIIRAGTAQSLVLDKQKKKKEKRLEMKRLKAMAPGGREVGSGTGDVDIEEETKATERVIAVDWALSKNKWEEERTKLEDVKMDDTPESASSASDGGDDGATNEEALGLHSDTESEDDHGGSQSDDEDNEGERIKLQLPPPETGTTVFVRNIPFDATEDELRTL